MKIATTFVQNLINGFGLRPVAVGAQMSMIADDAMDVTGDVGRGSYDRAKTLPPSADRLKRSFHDRAMVKKGIDRLLATKPMVEWADGRKSVRLRVSSDETSREHVEAIKAGELSFPRLEALHSLLAGSKEPGEILAVDGSSSGLPHLTAALARIGSKVVVKDRDGASKSRHMGHVLQHFGEWFEDGRIDYADIANGVDIGYWTDPLDKLPGRAWDMGVVEYLGRGLKRGGYLVMQGEFSRGQEFDLDFDTESWALVYSAALTEGGARRGLILPSAGSGFDYAFQVYQRK